MIRIIDDEFALPAPDEDLFRTFEYVRSLSLPTTLIDAKSGDGYVRRDGENWEHAGYKVQREATNRVKRTPATAPEDHATYRPAAQKSA